MAINLDQWEVTELGISQPMHVGWGGDKSQKLEYLIRDTSDNGTAGLTPTAVYFNTVEYPRPVGNAPSGAEDTFVINPHDMEHNPKMTGIGRKHPSLYDLGGGIRLRLAHFDARWYRGANRAVLVTMIWRLMRDPTKWIWSREHSLQSEETRLDIEGNVIVVPGMPPPVSVTRQVSVIVDKAVRQYYAVPGENATDILLQAVGKLNKAEFSGMLKRHWLFVGASIEPVDDWHWDWEFTFHGRPEGWDTFLEPLNSSGAPTEVAEVRLYEEADFRTIPGMELKNGKFGNPGFPSGGLPEGPPP